MKITSDVLLKPFPVLKLRIYAALSLWTLFFGAHLFFFAKGNVRGSRHLVYGGWECVRKAV